MKHIFSALFLVVFGLALSASAEFQASPAELAALEKQLAGAPLVRHALTDDDFDDHDDGKQTKGWNPISWFKNQFKNKCVCAEGKCDCCFKLKLFKSKACVTYATVPAEEAIQVSLTLDEKSLVDKKFSVKRDDNVCGAVPVKSLSFLNFCFLQQSTMAENGEIKSCSSLELKIKETTGAILSFQCLQVNGGKITFGGHEKIEKSSMFSLKIRNPFKVAVEIYTNSKKN